MSTHAPSSNDTSFGDLRIRRVAGHIGGEVEDFQLRPDLAPQQIEQLNAALVRHKVLFFRGQGHLDDASRRTTDCSSPLHRFRAEPMAIACCMAPGRNTSRSTRSAA